MSDDSGFDTKVDANFDYMYKVLIVGNSAVGKTAFLVRYCDETFFPAFVSTVGIDFKVKTLIRNDKRIKLQIWDTAGQERYRTITTAYYRGAMGFIIMFDLTSEDSFQAVRKWLAQIRDLSWEKARIVLVGNKCDLATSRVVTQDQATELAQTLGVKYIETSAKDDINVKMTFDALVDEISIKMAESVENNPNFIPGRPTIRPRTSDTQSTEAKSGCAC